MWCVEAEGVWTKLIPETSASVGIGIVSGKRDVFIFEACFGGSDTWHF